MVDEASSAEQHRWAALSPLDGRYGVQLVDVAAAFSEAALIRQRFRVEVEWLLALSACPGVVELTPLPEALLRGWVDGFDDADVAEIKTIERASTTTSRPSSTS